MSSTTCERCGGLPPPITAGPWKGSRHELRYCAYCSKDLCDKCLLEGTCRETPKGDKRHRVEADCPDCGGAGKRTEHHGRDDNYDAVDCATCDGTGTAVVLIEEGGRDHG